MNLSNRTIERINRGQPDLIYFDDTALPLWPVSDAGLKLAAHFYNRSNQWHGDDGVMFNKVPTPDQRACMAWNIERGVSIKSLGTEAKLLGRAIAGGSLPGSDEKLTWSQTAGALMIEIPRGLPGDIAVVFKITPRS